MRIACFASGRGSNFEALWRACSQGRLRSEIVLLVSNRPNCGAVEFARAHGVAVEIAHSKECGSEAKCEEQILTALNRAQPDLIILIGYLKRLGSQIVSQYRGRIINTHPGPLPEFGGKGMYGLHVHRAVLKSQRATTEVTIHYVDEIYDHGDVVRKTEVPVISGDSPESLQERVQGVEREFLIETVLKMESGGFLSNR